MKATAVFLSFFAILALQISCTHVPAISASSNEATSVAVEEQGCDEHAAFVGERSPSSVDRCAALFSSSESLEPASQKTSVSQGLSDSQSKILDRVRGSVSGRAQTEIEKALGLKGAQLNVAERLNLAIAQLRQEDSRLADLAVEAKRKKDRGESIRIDFSQLPSPMVNFIQGTYFRVVGARGISAPFIEMKALDADTLVIQHAQDRFPMMVKWSETASTFSRATEVSVGGTIYRLLELPKAFRSREQLNRFPEKYVQSLISASRLNRNISARDSTVARVSALLHDGTDFYDRATQGEYKQVREQLDTNPEFRKKLRSLLFVASTGVGKTRILTDGISNKLRSAQKALQADRTAKKKLTVLLTKTPDLSNELAQNIGNDLGNELGSSAFRLIKWGGANGEDGTLADLTHFVQNSDVPVVLVTNNQTMALRIKTDAEMNQLLSMANGLMIDEVHNNAGGNFERVMVSALQVADADRQQTPMPELALDILASTATPVTTNQRVSEKFDATYWGSVDRPKEFSKKILGAKTPPWDGPNKDVLEWKRMLEQYANARDRGEITAPDSPIYYLAEDRGFNFASLFKRAPMGTQSTVDVEKLKLIWLDISRLIADHGPGVIQTHPRDADSVAATLSALTGKRFVSLQSYKDGEKRDAIYNAFRDQSLDQNGQRIDGIVGNIREGLDFPKAGWYLNFKKYVRFPENLQGPGRVVRLSYDKLPPVIIFFGEETDRVAYQKVKDLIMEKLGRLPRNLPAGSLYTGARIGRPGNPLTKTVKSLNDAVEAVARIRSDLTRQLYATKAGDEKERADLNPAALKSLQEVLTATRRAGANLEVSVAFNQFVYEMNAFPFFAGDLKSTWAYCRKMLKVKKDHDEGKALPPRLSDQDKSLLLNPQSLAMMQEFLEVYSLMGMVPRAIVESLKLTPGPTLADLAEAVNVFVAKNKVLPYSTAATPDSLARLFAGAMRTSNVTMTRHLNYESLVVFDKASAASNRKSFEENLNDYFHQTQALPAIDNDIARQIQEGRTLTGNNEQRMARAFISYLRSGELRAGSLDVTVQRAIDSSDDYRALMANVMQSIDSLRVQLRIELGEDVKNITPELLNIDSLSHEPEYAALKVVRELAAQGMSNSKQYFDEISRQLVFN